ncbi:MAG: hypothetical protein O7C67_08635 [Gammaproteobacteria bacterium]|nr:hypothetical protein [Gammaproteobacteria bacterium]
MKRWLVAGGLCLVAACAPVPEVSFHEAGDYPEHLSEWGVVVKRGDRLALGSGVLPYDINTPLFSDYALKLRTIWLPDGTTGRYADFEAFDLPTGTILSKSFFYPMRQGVAYAAHDWDGDVGALDLDQVRLIETRLLVKQAHGWDALPYIWHGDDAILTITGDLQTFDLNDGGSSIALTYIVPTRNECAACHATNHTTGALHPIGIKTRHLNRGYHGSPANQLVTWQEVGWLEGLPSPAAWSQNADWQDSTESVTHLARSYLDANCGHCHNPEGAADTSGLWLDYQDHPRRQIGECKPPIAAGGGTGGRLYSIVPGMPDASILVFRMAETNPSTRMPEIGRTLVHRRGLDVVTRWVASLDGVCL